MRHALTHRHAVPVGQKLTQVLLPRVDLEALRCLCCGCRSKCHGHLPLLPRLDPVDGFGDELVTLGAEAFEVHLGQDAQHEEAACARLIAQVGIGVRRAAHDVAARDVGHSARVGPAEAVAGEASEGLDGRDLGTTEALELGDFDHPRAFHLLGGVFAPELRGELAEERAS